MNVSTKQLRGFVYAAEFASFTRAAERLHVTQTGLSAIIRELESQLGTRLFERTTRVIALTEAGRKLLPVARRTIADLVAVAGEVEAIEIRTRRTLRIGATPLVASKLLPAVCARLRLAHPQLTVRLLEIQRDPIQEQVASGALDVGLGIFLKTATGLQRQRLFESKLFCISPASSRRRRNPLSHVGRINWSALADKPLVALQPSNPVQQFIDRHLPHASRSTAERYAVNHIETQIAMAEIGTGVAIVPSIALSACRHYHVQVDRLCGPEIAVGFHRIIRKGRPRPEAVQAFCDELLVQMKPLLQY